MVVLSLAIFWSCLLFLAPLEVQAQDRDQPSEYQVKAAFICNLAKFVEWPSSAQGSPSSTITLGILGENPFSRELDRFQQVTIQGRKLSVKEVQTLKELPECQILFIGQSEKNRLERIRKALQGAGVLTIGDTKGFAERGVIINLYLQEKRVRFEINPEAARQAGLKVSSKLLHLGRIVQSGSPGKED